MNTPKQRTHYYSGGPSFRMGVRIASPYPQLKGATHRGAWIVSPYPQLKGPHARVRIPNSRGQQRKCLRRLDLGYVVGKSPPPCAM